MTETSPLTYDIIFAGGMFPPITSPSCLANHRSNIGGTTACIIAGRLAQADPSLKILILEAGPHSKDVPQHIQPARFFPSLAAAGERYTFHKSKPNAKLSGRAPGTVTGRCVGGGSAVNFLVYCRAAASDYDDWENVHGNQGWGSKSLIPLLRKAETYQGISTNATHGKSGPLKVSFAKSAHNVADEFLAIAAVYDNDREPIDDANGLFACDGYGRFARFVDGKSGRRSDTASNYLYPLLETNRNLTVLVRKRVVRVIFEGKRAVGIEYIDDEGDHSCALESPAIARATRLVVLSAGAFGSSAILERSGIGGAEILQKHGIQQVVDLPGVGENLRDHNLIFAPYIAADYADTLDTIFWGNEDEVNAYADEWAKTGQGLMQHNGIDAAIRSRPRPEDLKEIGPTFTEQWNSYFANAPDKPVMIMGALAAYVGTNPKIPRKKYFSMAYYTAYPASFGYSHITAGTNPYAPLNYDPRYLDDDGDLHILRWAYKHTRELARRMPMYRGELSTEHPEFPEGSEATTHVAEGPVPVGTPKIRYTEADNKAIDEYNKRFVGTSWHSCGTCSMKAREKGGVVDERLNVYDIEGLKVADMSIIPSNVGANTYNTAIAIGEKAAVIIAQDLGIKGVSESD